jgi:DNA-binding CsgD family transcriptional regulator
MAEPPIPSPDRGPEPDLVQAFARAAGSLGGEGFHQAMLDLLGTVCPIDAGGAMVYYRNRRPLQLLHRYDPAERSLPVDYYLSGPYALDPLYHVFLRGAPSGVYWLRQVAPDDFFQSEFHRVFFSRIGICDDIFVMWRMDPDTALVYFLERSVRHPAFQPGDLPRLQAMVPFVLAACGRHHQLAGPATGQGRDDLIHRKVQNSIENFGRSLLTAREREVLFHMLRGYSSATTAERLATTEGTIKIHRKNIHRKLDIGSQAELFSLFIDCIPFADPGGTADPLAVYQQRPGAAAGGARIP